MSLREKRQARRAEENEILKQMRDAAGETPAGSAAEEPAGQAASAKNKEAGGKYVDPSLRPTGGYQPLTDEQIRKTKLILWPILFVIAVIVYLATRGYFG